MLALSTMFKCIESCVKMMINLLQDTVTGKFYVVVKDALYAIDGECNNDHMCGEREKQMKDDIDRELRMRTRVVYLRPFQYGMNHGVEMVIASTDAALDDLVIVIAIVCTERWSPMPLTPEEGKPCPQVQSQPKNLII